MNFYKTELPSSHTSYKKDTYAKRWPEICGRFPSYRGTFGPTIPSNTNPKPECIRTETRNAGENFADDSPVTEVPLDQQSLLRTLNNPGGTR